MYMVGVLFPPDDALPTALGCGSCVGGCQSLSQNGRVSRRPFFFLLTFLCVYYTPSPLGPPRYARLHILSTPLSHAHTGPVPCPESPGHGGLQPIWCVFCVTYLTYV